MFRVSITPIIRSAQNCNYSLRYWSYLLCSYLLSTWPSLATLGGGICTVPEVVVTVLCTPDFTFYVYGSVHRFSILITVQRDATQSSLFIILQVHSTCFECQPHPSSGVHKTVTTASVTGRNAKYKGM